jgi:magnesium chelatase accessory protein
MAERLDWIRDGRDWPHREASSFVDAGGVRWHVQRFARSASGGHPTEPAPVALLLHGTGASGHSWGPMLPWLGRHFDLISVDLPGHAFSSLPASWQSSLPGMARAAGDLMKALGARPDVVIGHSAGAALAARMCLDGQLAPKLLISLNGAFLPLPGLAGVVFPPVAKVMAALPFAPSFFAGQAADPRSIDRLIDGTGSKLDAAGRALYARLVRNPGHVQGALAMMANWDVRPLLRDLPGLSTQMLLVVADKDKTVAPEQAQQVRAMCPGASAVDVQRLAELGHLAHEEDPAQVSALCVAAARAAGVAC